MTVSTQLMNLVNMKSAEHVVIVIVSLLSLAFSSKFSLLAL